MIRGLVGAGQAQRLGAKLSQVALHLLLLGPLDVVLCRVLQVSLDLSEDDGANREKKSKDKLYVRFRDDI